MPRLTDTQRAMVADHWPEALEVASWFAGRYPWLPVDWEGAVAVGLCEAALGYREGRRLFWSYGWNRCRCACLDEMRVERRRGFRRVGRNRVDVRAFPSADGDEGPAPGGPVGWEMEASDMVEALCRKLPRHHRAVVRLSYLNGCTLAAIGQTIGVGTSGACRTRAEALRMLREAI